MYRPFHSTQHFIKSSSLYLLMTLCLLSFSTIVLAQDCKVLDPNLEGVYTGECKNGKASGMGKSVGKYTYEGEFKAGLPEGQGTMIDDMGNRFKGNFKKGKREGEGLLFLKNSQGSDSVRAGFWKNDTYVGLYEKPFKVVNKSMMVSSLTITFDNPTIPSNNNAIELNMESVSGGSYSVLQGEIPKPVLKESIFTKGTYLQMISVTNEQKRNTYIFQNVTFPAEVIFKINNEEVQVEFNEAKNYKMNLKLKN
ncbi:MAG: hypothetical protein WCJ68_03340 [Chitinophagia bacterium]|jgi:MORN repeat